MIPAFIFRENHNHHHQNHQLHQDFPQDDSGFYFVKITITIIKIISCIKISPQDDSGFYLEKITIIKIISCIKINPQDDSGSTLTMTDVSVSDSGNYSCQV